VVSYELHVNLDKCEGCNICDVACPINADIVKKQGKLTPKNAVILVRNGKAIVYNGDKCNGCGVCIDACPQDAISVTIKRLVK
jgi:4Fe-4S ferredoxin